MHESCFKIRPSLSPLKGSVEISGAKNAALVILCSTVLTAGKSIIHNVPALLDVFSIVKMLEHLGAVVDYDYIQKSISIDTTHINYAEISYTFMNQTRASILILAPLLVRFQKAYIQGKPGGDAIGIRPIDFHIKNLKKMGVIFADSFDVIDATVSKWSAGRIVLDYPSVGATENIMMAAIKIPGTTRIINAALEPEVIDLILVLNKMGAHIMIEAPANIVIQGVQKLYPFEHTLIPDRLEAGALLIATAMTGGEIYLPGVSYSLLDLVLSKLQEMGNQVIIDHGGIRLFGTKKQKAVSFKTAPFPGFPTDLQPLLMASLLTAEGSSIIEETVYENRFKHIHGFRLVGGIIDHIHSNKAIVHGVQSLQGSHLVPTDIRAACAFVLIGLVAEGETIVSELHHFKRGFDLLDTRLRFLGADIELITHYTFSESSKGDLTITGNGNKLH